MNKELINRLNRIQGQIESIKKSLSSEEELDCLKTMNLIKAINNGIKKFGEEYVSTHLDTCLNAKNQKKNLDKDLKAVIEAAFTL
jgi:DNA-binding FrmR family transcriptional regulator